MLWLFCGIQNMGRKWTRRFSITLVQSIVTAHVVGKHLSSEELIIFVVAVLWGWGYKIQEEMDRNV